MPANSRQIDSPASEADSGELRVLVGFDGSELAALAVRYGAAEAARRKTTLTVLSIYTVPPMIYPNMASIPSESEDVAAKAAAEQIVSEAVELLRDYHGPKSFRTAPGNPTGGLVTLSSNAEVIVVGARGLGGFMGRVLGSVSMALPAHAHCPTIIVPDDGPAPGGGQGPVVVAVDGSEASRVAMFAAAAEASVRDADLEVVSVLPTGDEWLYWYPDLELSAEVSGRRQKQLLTALQKEVAQLSEQFPDLSVDASVPRGNAAHELAATTGRAQLTVMGTRGRGRVRSALLGSVSRGVLNRAQGPVMIVPN